jgi:hypothetical protein
MEIAAKAIELNGMRMKSLQNPSRYGFKANRMGRMQKTIATVASLRTPNGIVKLDETAKICIADIDPNSDTPESELVRNGVWKQFQCQCMWLWYCGKTTLLAIVSPNGVRQLRNGFITNNDTVIDS